MQGNNVFIVKNNFSKKIVLKVNENSDFFFLNSASVEKDLLVKIDLLENSKVNLHFLILALGQSKLKVFVKINHNGSNTISNCNVKIIAANDSFTSVNIDSFIEKGTNNFTAIQNIDGLILGENATIEASPNLLVNTDTGICEHSVNLGNISQEKIFYLMTRGLTKNEAIKLIVFSYFNIILSNIKNDKIKYELSNQINKIYEIYERKENEKR